MKFSSLVSIFLGGALFGFGLTWSGMNKPEVVLTFLRFEDYGLMLVLGSATTTTLLVYQLAPRVMGKPLLEQSFGSHFSAEMKPTIIGAAIFGVGWGISGLCPAPAIAGLGMGSWNLLVALAAMFAGSWCHGLYMSRTND